MSARQPSRILLAAAAYNLVWGASVVLFPGWFFAMAGMEPPAYPQIWQCVGMIVGVYGIGYAIAAFDPIRHWPIVLVGFLGKVFGPIGFIAAVAEGAFTLRAGLTILTNDLIWWVPFGLLLWQAAKARVSRPMPEGAPPLGEALREFALPGGETLAEASRGQPLYVLFLRHFGCTFCREALAEVRRHRPQIEAAGCRIVLVHPAGPEEGAAFLRSAGMDAFDAIADPEGRLYAAFDLGHGRISQLFGWREFVRGAAASLRGHRVGKVTGDAFRMPGLFIVEDVRITREYRHRSAGDRPDYLALAGRPARG